MGVCKSLLVLFSVQLYYHSRALYFPNCNNRQLWLGLRLRLACSFFTTFTDFLSLCTPNLPSCLFAALSTCTAYFAAFHVYSTLCNDSPFLGTLICSTISSRTICLSSCTGPAIYIKSLSCILLRTWSLETWGCSEPRPGVANLTRSHAWNSYIQVILRTYTDRAKHGLSM